MIVPHGQLCCLLQCNLAKYTYTQALGLLLGTEAPVMTPNGIDLSLLFLLYTGMADAVVQQWNLPDSTL